MHRFIILIFLLASFTTVHAQLELDRHNTSSSKGWISCDRAESPVSGKDAGHWIMYDFNAIYELGKTHFWNLNVSDNTDSGIQEMSIDVSIDGEQWENIGNFKLTKAPASNFYTGEEGPDLTGVDARYVLITAVQNYGGNCAGLAEVRFETRGTTTSTDDFLPVGGLSASPSPFADQTVIEIEDIAPGNYTYRIYDLAGRLIKQDKLDITGSNHQVIVNGAGLPDGVLSFMITDGLRTKTILIEKMNN